MQEDSSFRKRYRFFTIFSFLYFFLVLQICDGNSWTQVESKAVETEFFQPFSQSDYALLGLTAIADFADLDSSYSSIEHDLSVYNSEPRYGTSVTCDGILAGCLAGHRRIPFGEVNPMITGMFGTKYPTALDYTAFGALELAVQAGIAWAVPEGWRKGAWGLFLGIGLADTVFNSYRGGVTFRF
ncbi:MAG: hypothetical protein ACYCT9_00525 [Leptospirillum sp.]|jgi:hypothetical protein